MDDLLIISALDDTQTHQEGNSLCFTFKSIMESKTSVLRVKIWNHMHSKNISLTVCMQLTGTKSSITIKSDSRSWKKKEHKKKITLFLTTILNSNHGIWLDVLNDHVVTYFCQGSTIFLERPHKFTIQAGQHLIAMFRKQYPMAYPSLGQDSMHGQKNVKGHMAICRGFWPVERTNQLEWTLFLVILKNYLPLKVLMIEVYTSKLTRRHYDKIIVTER